MIGLLPDDEVVEIDTLLVLLLDLADDRAEVLNVLKKSWHQHRVGWKVGWISTPATQVTNFCNAIGQFKLDARTNSEQGELTSSGLICSAAGRRVWEMEHCN